MGILERLAGLLKGRTGTRDVQQLRSAFRTQFELFQQLIASNRAALEKMAEIEEALLGRQPLGINFARSRCASVKDNVSKMVHLLNEMHPGKYEELFLKLREIEHEISSHVVSEPRPSEAQLVLRLDELDRTFAGQVGDKMANLGELRNRLGLKTPDGFVVTEDAYWQLMERGGIQEEIDKLLAPVSRDEIDLIYDLSRRIQVRIMSAEIPEELEQALQEHGRRLESDHGVGIPLAVRSSAQGEDKPGRSCAGMYRTLLGKYPDDILESYRQVVASKYEPRAMIYRLNYGIRDDHVAMCVGFMPLVPAVCGGVAYSRNPLDTSDTRVMVHAAFGLGGAVVEGSARSDLIVISRGSPPEIAGLEIAHKRKKTVFDRESGISEIALSPERGDSLAVEAEVALRLADEVARIEAHYGVPQDVEWALDENGSLVFLQCRPLVQRETSPFDGDDRPVVEICTETLLEGRITASPGAAAGRAVVVQNELDAIRFPQGGVLVAAQPLPDWAVAMRRAVAVVCEQGSVAGHLANVAREMHVPALFGAEGALDKIATGEPITVDADHKRVYRGAIESLLKRWSKPTHPAQVNAVFEALEDAAAHIVHLNLVDPDDRTKFTAGNCETLHDITRFCHEKALRQMFRFGDDHQFPERAAKHLHVDGPTQFWIIDMADGLTATAHGKKKIGLDQIQSAPMLALWRGMMTIPWEQPPVDTRGFMEVLAGSAANPGLNPALPSPYSQPNYFMITRKFCSSKTRFGYHFSTVEALVGDRRRENYVSFNFRGGAAGERRRARRAHLVSDILAENDFRVHIIGDSVHARLEKYRQDFLEPRLEVIGFLMLHTRQLDMVLTDNAAVKRYHRKFKADIARMHEITRGES